MISKIIKSEIFKTIAISMIIALMFKFTFLICIVRGESMYPTLKDNQIQVAINSHLTDINRDDIVVIKHNNRFLIKRVVGLPGESVEYKDGKLYINNKLVDDKFSDITDDYSVNIGSNEYFCLGDNRNFSADSRTYGCFSRDSIEAVDMSSRGQFIW